MPNILITSGGTAERIDDARSITNHSTGLLGREIAYAFAREGCKIIYIRGQNAPRPDLPHIREIVIDDVASLETAVNDIFENYEIDIIIHAMAVSDFRIKHAALLEAPN